eukprot:681592-Alexandrium_andersonii.AAC.1
MLGCWHSYERCGNDWSAAPHQHRCSSTRPAACSWWLRCAPPEKRSRKSPCRCGAASRSARPAP